MVKSVLGVYHRGLRDWAIQRASAFYMAIYTLSIIVYFLLFQELNYIEWHGLFTQGWMKILTIFFILGLLFHAWVGMWTIFTDYVKPFVIRLILDALVIMLLAACFLWGVMILWSV
jgi:succinate dehydrogenase / fumarate reductase membrane anchor subunit